MDSSNNIQAGETTLPNANAKQNPLDLNRLDSWLRAMRNPAEAVETLQPEILHVPINSSKASVLPEALHDTPIPTPLGESWTGPPLSRQEVESRLQQHSLRSKTWGQMMQEQEDLYGVSPSAFLYAVQEPCVFLQRVVNISGATVVMDPNADVVRAAIICSTHLNVWPVPEFCSGDMVTCILKTKKHGNIYVVSLYCDGEKQPIPDMLKTLHGKARKDGMQLLILGTTLQSMMNAKLSKQRF